MNEALPNFEGVLRQALAPVEPPEDLTRRLEVTLESLTEIAAEELESWELRAMRDPRNWARPLAAVVVGTSAGAALVLLRARHRQRPLTSASEVRELTERTLHAVSHRAGKLLPPR